MKRFVAAVAVTTLALAAPGAQAAGFRLESSSLKAGAPVRPEHYWNSFGCSGGNVMPDLAWRGAPEGTKSYAVTFYDRDAPTGSGFWHWVVYDIPASVTSLPGGVAGGTLPAGAIEGNTDLGKPGFLGPCPPVGRTHRYVFTVHALKVDRLPVDQGATPALVGFFLWQNAIATATTSVKAGPRKEPRRAPRPRASSRASRPGGPFREEARGKARGLDLATVYGIVTQRGGPSGPPAPRRTPGTGQRN